MKFSFFPLRIRRISLLLRQRLGHHDQVPAKTTSGAAGTKIKYPRRTTGAFAGNGLGTTPNYLRGAEGNDRAKR
jgi:hypothetical protein